MAYDAGMLRAVLAEMTTLAVGGRVERVVQPSADEVDLFVHAGRETVRLCVQVGSNAPRLSLSRIVKDNPLVAPMFCMLLRKHLTGAHFTEAAQCDFERAAALRFSCRDDMGYETERTLMVEIMGKYSNLMMLDAEGRILGAMRQVDFSTSRMRQVLPGMKYELPPPQDKLNPLTVTQADMRTAFSKADMTRPLDKFVAGAFLGIAAVTAREVAYRATGSSDTLCGDCTPDAFVAAFTWLTDSLKANEYHPTLILGTDGLPVEYTYFTPSDPALKTHLCPDFADLLDNYYGERERAERMRTRAADIIRLLSNAEGRLTRKLEAQRMELADASKGDEYKAQGDLITANLYQLKRGMASFTATDYTQDPPTDVNVRLDTRLTPAANAQRFYKKYTKAKHARTILTEQIAGAESELAYLAGVRVFLDKAETEMDLNELRDELYRTGYASRMKNYTPQKNTKPRHMTFRTTGGYTLLCGKNNVQNDYLTFRLAEKNDLWFHIKGMPGSHVILVTGGEEPGDVDYTEAAELAAFYSHAGRNATVAVDYTRVRQVKKPAGAKPGYVIYHTNYTAYVCPRLSVSRVDK